MPRLPKAFLSFFCLLSLTGCLGSQPPAPVVAYGLRGGAGSAGMHTVAPGDTVWDIAQRYKLSMQDIITVNNIRPPYSLGTGRRLKLPPPAIHVVKEEDTLYGIAHTYGVGLNEVARQNNLKAPYTIHAGNTLRLPSVVPLLPKRAIARASLPPPKPGAPPKRVASSSSASKTKSKKVSPQQVLAKAPQRAGSKFMWPVSGPVLSSYGPKEKGQHNDGINIKAPKGAPVRAAENGVVVYADNQLKGFGNLILIRHADRWMTAYAHMDRFHVKKGQQVNKGDTIGTVGSTGSAESPQLHFEIRRGTEALNPTFYLARQGT